MKKKVLNTIPDLPEIPMPKMKVKEKVKEKAPEKEVVTKAGTKNAKQIIDSLKNFKPNQVSGVSGKASKDESAQSKPVPEKEKKEKKAEVIVVPVGNLEEIKETSFHIASKNSGGAINDCTMEVHVPLTEKFMVTDQGKKTKRNYLRAIYNYRADNKLNKNTLLINEHSLLVHSQINAIHVAVGKMVVNKIKELRAEAKEVNSASLDDIKKVAKGKK